ncbi:MAG: DNA double-strand break repair nuclease NurA, partial [Anaerolineales bacterium]|nr:DNA double-strand break repair nuclease NurA [Anaerolineales bacterium]
FTDGPIELWSRPEPANAAEFQESLEAYQKVLAQLREKGVATAGYVDRPGANHVVSLLEVGMTPEDQLAYVRAQTPLRGAADRYLFAKLLPPGARSAVFGLQAKSADTYQDELSLHFFYLNVGTERKAKIARVEIPAWVANDQQMLDPLHAVLVNQSKVVGSRAYPYILHRAHEAAVVTRLDREQVTQMIMLELRRRGLEVGELSEKQFLKGIAGRNRY